MRDGELRNLRPWYLVWALSCVATPGCAPYSVCSDGQVVQAVRGLRHPTAGVYVVAHSHNDYKQKRPLLDAIDHRFYSVEADIHYNGGRLSVAHMPWGYKGTLKDLYLDPLQRRITARGSVYGDGVAFTLWIDLKEGSLHFINALYNLLEQYPMLTRVEEGRIRPGMVTVVLTGSESGKLLFTSRYPRRNALRDSNHYSPDDPPADGAWNYYALSWSSYLSSSPTGELDAEQQARLACIVENAHKKGRQLRMFAAPDHPDMWMTALRLGVDFINTDNPAGLSKFLTETP